MWRAGVGHRAIAEPPILERREGGGRGVLPERKNPPVTDWLADLVEEHHKRRGYPHKLVGIYGKAFKAGTNLTVGSPAILLANLLRERGYAVHMWDPHVDRGACTFSWAG